MSNATKQVKNIIFFIVIFDDDDDDDGQTTLIPSAGKWWKVFLELFATAS